MPTGLETYPHDARSHKHWKFEKLRERHGWAGEGRFWALNGIIASSSASCLDLSDPGVVPMLQHELGFADETDLRAYLAYLDEDCRLVQRRGTVLTTGMVQDALARITAKRLRNHEDYQRRQQGAEKLPISIPPPPDPAISERTEAQREAKEEAERRFDRWWSEYPLKRDKPKARAKYLILARKVGFPDLADAALARQKVERADRETKGYWSPQWKYPKSWLNAESWNDSPLPFTSGYLATPPHGNRHTDKAHKQGRVSTTGSADHEV